MNDAVIIDVKNVKKSFKIYYDKGHTLKELVKMMDDTDEEIEIKLGKKHITFYSCEKYPECNFSSWDIPTGEKCPQCGDALLAKKRKKLVYCRNEKCGYSREEKKSKDEK